MPSWWLNQPIWKTNPSNWNIYASTDKKMEQLGSAYVEPTHPTNHTNEPALKSFWILSWICLFGACIKVFSKWWCNGYLLFYEVKNHQLNKSKVVVEPCLFNPGGSTPPTFRNKHFSVPWDSPGAVVKVESRVRCSSVCWNNLWKSGLKSYV